jgi:serine/threonine protein kinase
MLNAEQTVVKITDFGLCRQSNVDYEYVSENNNQQLPFRWTAIECFGSSRFSEKSDVWSFGVVVWEV